MKNDISLIPLKESHLELVRTWRNSPEVSSFMYTSELISPEAQKQWFNRTIEDKTSKYYIIQYNEKLLGVASLTNISSLFESCYWAFYIGDNTVRGSGIGSKVEYNILSYVFDELGLNKLRCEVFSFNEKVIQMHEKFGFRREAYYRQHVKKDGSYKDVVGLALLRHEWILIKKEMKLKIYGE